MIQLDNRYYHSISFLYQTLEEFFPLIGAVLSNDQDGVVYTNNAEAPTQFYVEHKFGFSQIFGLHDHQFESDLRSYLLLDKQFLPSKIRLYTPYYPEFLLLQQPGVLRSERQRFILDPSYDLTSLQNLKNIDQNIRIASVNQGNVSEIETIFSAVSRFWRNSEEFLSKAHPVIALVNEKPAAICYAAAVADNRAEIDVMTLPEFRNLGLGKRIVTFFNLRTLKQGIQPLWDCYTNNTASMMLCESTGFIKAKAAYPFFTINK